MSLFPQSHAEAPSGAQWVIAHGYQQAVITEVGATLRSYRIGERAVISGFDVNAWSLDGRGQVLAPWPDRVADGRYSFGDLEGKIAIDDPERGCAIHGLVRWRPFTLESQAQNMVAATCRLRPQPDYPFALDLIVEYRLRRDGLMITTRATNVGDRPCPFALGFQLLLEAPKGRVDTSHLQLPANQRMTLDRRGLPAGHSQPVSGTEFDFRQGRVIGPARVDAVFTDFGRDDHGFAWAAFEDPTSKQGIDVWMDPSFRYLRCSTGDGLDGGSRRGALVFVPMSAPPDALRSGDDLATLEPGRQWSGAWGLQPR